MIDWLLASALVLQTAASQPAPASTGSRKLSIHGEAATLAAAYPNQDDTKELRTRVSIDLTADPTAWLRLKFEGFAEGLLADRMGQTDDAMLSVRDAWAEVRLDDVEVRAGYGRLVWGRLDEIMPSDVINPIDASRFFLNGRSDARMPVGFIRTRYFLPAEASIEAVLALPGTRGRFDSLDEPSSPFNLMRDLAFPASTSGVTIHRKEPTPSWQNLQGGLRASASVGQVDMSVSVWRGFEGFGNITYEPVTFEDGSGPGSLFVGRLVERYPRFTMIAGDAEMVRGEWAIRSEVAAFVDKTLTGPLGAAKGKAIDAGVGVDRAAGDYHLFGSVVFHREWFTSPQPGADSQQHLNLIASVDRRFAREKYLARVFGVVNPDDKSGFVRGLFSWSVRDNVLIEASGGAFLGEGTDTIGRFNDRDFVFVRAKYSF